MQRIHCLALICLLSAKLSGVDCQRWSGIINSTIVAHVSEFPQHVGIFVPESGYCSGVIIAPSWLLTAQTCLGTYNDAAITLMFQRRDFEIDGVLEANSYNVQITQSRVIKHQRANLALIRLPFKLEHVRPIAIAAQPTANGQLAVLSGPNENGTKLAYGELEIITSQRCAEVYPWFNATEELCTLGWQGSSTVPCKNAHGGGLLVNWPSEPRLVAIFSAPLSCLSYVPAEYYRLSYSREWIEQVTDLRLNKAGYFEQQ